MKIGIVLGPGLGCVAVDSSLAIILHDPSTPVDPLQVDIEVATSYKPCVALTSWYVSSYRILVCQSQSLHNS